MKSAAIRQIFLDYFKQRGHEVVASGSLIPAQDPTLLFTNAGMVPFKEVFTGQETRPYQRATSVQRCVRAGGKHNDLDNVGYTARHHTFFEMLGNFSFGDYFKREAIEFAWDMLTNRLGLAEDKLWITVYEEDDEAADIWLNEIKVSPSRFSRCGKADNFWAMGDTGPCGPCSEIFYDHGPDIAGGPPGSPDADGDRYIEIWNLVFMQYDQAPDGSRTPLPKPSVDTGMGLERLAAVLQGVHNNYDTDIFVALINKAAELTHTQDKKSKALRVIADHIRSSSFLICDGIEPSNEGRGYVLRRIIRRACRHGHELGVSEPFFHRLLPTLVAEMGEAYPELAAKAQRIQDSLLQEEQQFNKTLAQGMRILQRHIAQLTGAVIPGDVVFKLYDTYGFPMDLTADIARGMGLEIDEAGFGAEMQIQRQRSQAAHKFAAEYQAPGSIKDVSTFVGYTQNTLESCHVVALLKGGERVEQLQSGDEGIVLLDKTPFYAEGGGQVGDVGFIADFVVVDTQKQNQAHLHYGQLAKGQLKVGDTVCAQVNNAKRTSTQANHSATHLLHTALQSILSEHVEQKGSLVEPARLRFDFSHSAPVTEAQLAAIENHVNQAIQANHSVRAELMSMTEAKALGAMALFGEKYGDVVRVLSMGDVSIELCGGTHVTRTGDIGLFKITTESGIAAGVRRIEALTGSKALDWVNQHQASLAESAALVNTSWQDLPAKLHKLLDERRNLEKQMASLKAKLASSQLDDILATAQRVNETEVVAVALADVDASALRHTIIPQLKEKLSHAAVVLASVNGGKVSLVAAIFGDCPNLHAGKLVNFVAEQVGGKGGGKPNLAQAGGKDPTNLAQALASVTQWVQQMQG